MPRARTPYTESGCTADRQGWQPPSSYELLQILQLDANAIQSLAPVGNGNLVIRAGRLHYPRAEVFRAGSAQRCHLRRYLSGRNATKRDEIYLLDRHWRRLGGSHPSLSAAI